MLAVRKLLDTGRSAKYGWFHQKSKLGWFHPSWDGVIFLGLAILGVSFHWARRESPVHVQPCRYLRSIRKILATWCPLPRSVLSLLQSLLYKIGMRKGEVKEERKEGVKRRRLQGKDCTHPGAAQAEPETKPHRQVVPMLAALSNSSRAGSQCNEPSTGLDITWQLVLGDGQHCQHNQDFHCPSEQLQKWFHITCR